MKFLILSFSAGEGHNSAARAIREKAEALGHTVEIKDYFTFYSEKISKEVDKSYVNIVRHTPYLFGLFYNITLWWSNILWKRRLHSASRLMSKVVAKKLYEYMQEVGPFDACVSTHVLSAQVFSILKEEHPDFPMSIFVATDYATYPYFSEATKCDYFVIPSEDLREAYEKQGAPAEKILVYGIPTDMRFQNLVSKEEAREKLGFSPDRKYFLLMGGSMGAGSLKRLAIKLYKKTNDRIVVVCGRNEELKKSVEKAFEKDTSHRVIVLGFTKDIPLYMRACDVLYTKPGGLSSSEALVCGIPLVHTAPIPGCETGNFKYFAKHLCAMPSKTTRAQLKNGIRLTHDTRLVAKMREQQKKHEKGSSSTKIIELLVNKNP